MKQHDATAQLLASDAVDQAVARINFAPLSGQKVYLDTQYLRDTKNVGFVNAQYVISSLRQQMLAAGVLLQDAQDKADYIAEARLGALGSDESELVYGIPANNSLSAAANIASTVAPAPPIPTIPELSIARRHDEMSAAKVAVFAYDRISREPVWQSGLSVARSTSRDFWIAGAGPFQRGSIHEGGIRFAGSKLKLPFVSKEQLPSGPLAAYRTPRVFQDLDASPIPDPNAAGEVELVGSESEKQAERTAVQPPETGR